MHRNIYRALAFALAILGSATGAAPLQAAPLPQNSWTAYTVVAQDQIYVGPNRNLSGNFVVLGAGGHFELGTDSFQAGGVVAAQSARLQKQSSVERLYTRARTGQGSVRIEQQSSDFPPPNFVLPPTVTRTTDCVTVADNIDVPKNSAGPAIRARCYRNVTIRDGASLTLPSGTYQLRSLTIGKGATLRVEGTATVKVRRAVRIQPEANIAPDSRNPADLVFRIESEGSSNVIGRLSRIVARFVSPNDDSFRIEQFTNITGTVLAGRVDMIGFHGEPPPPDDYCGDGKVQGNETCDDGINNGTGNPGAEGKVCRADCTYCGDAILQDGEFCDRGDLNGTSNECYANCRACGDDICQSSFRSYVCFDAMPGLPASQTTDQCDATYEGRENAGLSSLTIVEDCDLGSRNGVEDEYGPVCPNAPPPDPNDPTRLFECSDVCQPAIRSCASGAPPDPNLGQTCEAGSPSGYWDNICRTAGPDFCTVCGDGIVQIGPNPEVPLEECDNTGPDCGPDCKKVPDTPGVCSPFPENIFKNRWGLENAIRAAQQNGRAARTDTAQVAQTISAEGSVYAGPVLNIGGDGQIALGPWYDVRSNDGDAQQVLIQIRNSNTGNENLPACTRSDFARGTDGALCYNPYGGILARVRFRDSMLGTQALSYSIALGCGQIWAGNLQLGPNGMPQLRSRFPVVVEEDPTSWRTAPAFEEPQPFTQAVPGNVTNWQTGSFEIIGVESIPCAPEEPRSFEGNRWAKSDSFLREAASNHLAAQVFLVRVGAGVSYAYRTPAIARFAARGLGPIPIEGGILNNLDAPTLADCLTFRTDGEQLLTPSQCVSAVNLALTSAQLSAQFDISPLVGGETRVITTLPTLNLNCAEGDPFGTGPFSCDPDGESMRCVVSDREGNTRDASLGAIGGNQGTNRCRLPRATTEISLRADLSRNDLNDPLPDISLWTDRLPFALSGTLKLYFDRGLSGELLHGETLPDGLLNVFGRPATGYEGLPLLSLTIQEYRNGNVGGTYGNSTPTGSFDKVLYPGG